MSTLSYLRIRIGHTVFQKIAFIALVAFFAFLTNPILCEAAVGYGTAVQLHSEDNPATYLWTRTLDSTHFVEVFTDETNSNYGTAVIGTVSGTSVSFGSKVVFNTNSTYYSNVIVIDATHIAVVYVNSSYDGKARIGTISGDSISFGAEATFDATQVETFSAKLLDSTHIVIGYAAYEGGYLGRAVVGTISGTTISFGSYATFNSGWVYYGPTLSVFDSTHFIIFYGERVASDARARMILGTVSGGTTLSFGTETNFSASTTIYITPDGSDTLDATHVAVLYRDPAIDNNAVRTFIVTWDGGTTLTVGTSKKHDITPNISRAMSITAVNATTFVANFSQQSNYNGSSFVGTVTDGSTITLGSVYNFDAAGTEYDVSGDMLDSTHLIVTYRDRDDSNRSTAVVGTLAGNVISFGAENSMNSHTGYIGTVAADALDATHAVVAYTSASANGRASIATIAGTAVSLGTASTFNATTTSQTAVVMLDATHFIAAYRDSDTYGRAIVGTVSDTTITYGSEYAFNSAATTYISVTALDSTHFIVAYKDSDNYGRAVVGTISGTTISYGSEYVFNSAATSYISVTALDATHFIAAYQDSDAYGRAIVGTVSDTAIAYGSEYAFNSASTSYVSAAALSASTFVVAYKDSDTYGRAIVGTVSGTAISYGSEYAFNAAATNYIAIDKISATQFIAGYSDSGNSSYGTLLTGTLAGTVISFDAESAYTAVATSINTITTLSSSSFLASYRNDAATVGMTIVASNDSSPPVPSSFSPASASTISDATQTITFTTDENATCKVSLTDQAYADMSVNCTGGGTTSQSCTTPDLGADGAKTVYIACTDGTNADTADTNENLSYTLDTTPPTPSGFSPASSSTIALSTPTITFTTNENATCKVSLTDQAYADMSVNCTGGGTTSQSCTTPDLGADGAKTVYIACTDGTNADTADTNENLSYTLDTTSPSIAFSAATPADTSYQSGSSITIAATTSDAGGVHSVVLDWNNSLKGWWKLNTDGEMTDASGNSITATNHGATFTTSGRFGGAYTFDGNDYLDMGIPSAAQAQSTITMAAWVKSSDVSAGYRDIIANQWNFQDSGIMLTTNGASTIHVPYSNGTVLDSLDATYTVADGAWHLLVVTFDAGVIKIYADGVLRSSKTSSYATSIAYNGSNHLLIGKDSGTGGTEYWNGSIDDVQIFNRALSSDEILALYDTSANQYSRSFTGLANGTSYTFKIYSQDLAGNTASSVRRTFTMDSAAPVISSIDASVTSSTATITWSTDTLASSRVQYGTTDAFGLLTDETDRSPRVLSPHTVTLSGLPVCTTFSFRPISRDVAGNSTNGSTGSFTTSGCTNAAPVTDQQRDTIAAGGGDLTLTSDGLETTVTAPTDLDRPTLTIQIKKIDTTTVMTGNVDTMKPTGKTVLGDQTYDIRALNGATLVSTFLEPITISMEYTDAQVDGYNESSLWIYRWDGAEWNALDACVVQTNTHSVTCTTTHFSTFGLFGSRLASSAVTSPSPTTALSYAGGLRDVSIAGRVAVGQTTLLARFQENMRQSVVLQTETAHAAPQLPDADASLEERSLYRATVKVQESAEDRTLENLRLSRISQQRGKLLALVGEAPILYTDVDTHAWFAPYVATLVAQNIATGYADADGKPTGEFGVGNPVTYAEVLKMALKASDKDVSALPPPRNPSAQGTWASSYVSEAEAMKISVFVPSLDVHTPATRGAVVQTILEVLGLPIANQTSQFSDVSPKHPYAAAIATAAFYGIVTGDTTADGSSLNTFRPDACINRAEVAKIIALVKDLH